MSLPLDVRTRLSTTLDALDVASKHLAQIPTPPVAPIGTSLEVDANFGRRRRAAIVLLGRSVDLEEVILAAAAALPEDVAVALHALIKLSWAQTAAAFAVAGVTIARVPETLAP